jgi:hypothetical protein
MNCVKCLTVVFSVTGVCLFAGVMLQLAAKYNDRVCEIRYGAGDNNTLQVLLEHPLVQYAGEQTCQVVRSLDREELMREPSLMEQIWNKIAPSGIDAPHKYRLLAREMLEKCGENVLRGPCCERCVKYRIVTGET